MTSMLPFASPALRPAEISTVPACPELASPVDSRRAPEDLPEAAMPVCTRTSPVLGPSAEETVTPPLC